jgi:hypothetical protein
MRKMMRPSKSATPTMQRLMKADVKGRGYELPPPMPPKIRDV